MITSEDLYILDENEYQIESNNFSIIEIERNNNIVMELAVEIQNKNIIKVFCKKDQNKQDKDQCKLLFLKFQNFPDGVYLELTNDLIICHIYELKTSPVSSAKLDKISKQFINAKFHLISLFSIIGIDLNRINFRYNVGYVQDLELKDEYNSKSRNPKVVPGKPVTLPRHYNDWINSKLSFTLGNHRFEENISKLQMDFIHEDTRKKKYYKKEIAIV